MHRGLALRLGALDAEIVRIVRLSEGVWTGPAAERFRRQLEERRRVIQRVRNELLSVPS